MSLVEDNEDCISFDIEGGMRGKIWIDAETHDVLRLDRSLSGLIEIPLPRKATRRGGSLYWTMERWDSSIRFKRVTFEDPQETLVLPVRIVDAAGHPRQRHAAPPHHHAIPVVSPVHDRRPRRSRRSSIVARCLTPLAPARFCMRLSALLRLLTAHRPEPSILITQNYCFDESTTEVLSLGSCWSASLIPASRWPRLARACRRSPATWRCTSTRCRTCRPRRICIASS